MNKEILLFLNVKFLFCSNLLESSTSLLQTSLQNLPNNYKFFFATACHFRNSQKNFERLCTKDKNISKYSVKKSVYILANSFFHQFNSLVLTEVFSCCNNIVSSRGANHFRNYKIISTATVNQHLEFRLFLSSLIVLLIKPFRILF